MPGTILRKLVGVLPLLAAFITIVQAQPLEPCVPDCPETPWETNLLGHATDITCGDHTCRVVIWYRKRIACYTHDVNIVAITKDINKSGCEDACSFDDLIRECTRALLMEDPMGFPPRKEAYGQCDETWRVSSATCWHLNAGDLFNPHPTYYACNYMCCLARYRVCQVDPYNRTYELLDSYNPEITPICEFPCFFTCAVALPSYPKIGLNDTGSPRRLPCPNPARSSIAIPYSIAYAGNVTAVIYDIDGRDVARSDVDHRDRGDWTISMDVSDLARGTYLYTVECNGRQVARGPLTIAW